MLPPSSSSKEGQSNAFVSSSISYIYEQVPHSRPLKPAHPWDAVVSAEMAAVITTLRRNQRWNIDSPVMSNSRSASESPGLRKTQPFSVLDAAAESSTTVADIQTFLATVVADKRVVGLGRQVDATLIR